MYWHLLSSFDAAPPPPEWRERLPQLLGERPRRLGLFAELALYGALECLNRAPRADLSVNLVLRLGSSTGAASATHEITRQRVADGMPMPFSFLQSQPAQTLAAIARYLNWQGDACFQIHDAPLTCLHLACIEAAAMAAPVLCGWADDWPSARTHWLYLQPVDHPQAPADLHWQTLDDWRIARSIAWRHLKLDAGQLFVAD